MLTVVALSLAFLIPDVGRPFFNSFLLQALATGENKAPPAEEDTQHESAREGGAALGHERNPSRKARPSTPFLRPPPVSGRSPSPGQPHDRSNRPHGQGGLGVPLRC